MWLLDELSMQCTGYDEDMHVFITTTLSGQKMLQHESATIKSELTALNRFLMEIGYTIVGGKVVASSNLPRPMSMDGFESLKFDVAVAMYNCQWEKVDYPDYPRFIFRMPRTGVIVQIGAVQYYKMQAIKADEEIPVVHVYKKRDGFALNALRGCWESEINTVDYLRKWAVAEGGITVNGTFHKMTDNEFRASNLVEGGWAVIDGTNYSLMERL